MSRIVHDALKTAMKGTVLVLGGSVASTLFWFASKVLLVRHITKEELGLYTLAVAISGFVGAVTTIGIPDGITRFISLFLGEGRRDDATAISRAALRAGNLVGIAVTLLLFVLAEPLSRYVFYKPELTVPLRIASFFVFFHNLAFVLIGVLRGYGFIQPHVYFISLGQPLFFLVLLGVVLAAGLPLPAIVAAYVGSLVLACVGIAAFGFGKMRLNPLTMRGCRHTGELIGFSYPLIGAAIAVMLSMWTDTFMLGRYTTAEDVGIYSVGVSLSRLLGFPLQAVVFVFMPLAGELLGQSRNAELKRTYQVLTKWIFLGTLPVFFVLFFFPEMTITFLFGERFTVASVPLRLLCLGLMANAFLGAREVVLTALGMPRVILKIHVLGALMNVFLNYVLIKRLGFGITGAATATMLSYFVVNLAGYHILHRTTGIHPFTPGFLKPAAGSAAVGLVIYVAAKNLPLYPWMMPLYLLLFVGGYLSALVLSRSIEAEDVALMEAVLQKTGIRSPLALRLVHALGRKATP